MIILVQLFVIYPLVSSSWTGFTLHFLNEMWGINKTGEPHQIIMLHLTYNQNKTNNVLIEKDCW